ncbi:hypothetical protein BCR39DRAFT_590164 [Naematelia encephala]|uniref:Zn(2)-C6 fungal-type domain-containing protein n=1 Tax=Naematelia encephala TaxID=71784 RepID=A0A1Y2AU52_9TREE|nr:hypothetical protein BCR39DRAFT_590164 [Naematelia encephala]
MNDTHLESTITTPVEGTQGTPGDISRQRRKSAGNRVKSCAECRRLKLKCDRRLPCDNCGKRGIGSICPHGVLKSTKARTMILENNEALHDRIASLEQALRLLTTEAGGHPLLQRTYNLEPEGALSGWEEEEDNMQIVTSAAKRSRTGGKRSRLSRSDASSGEALEASTGSGVTDDYTSSSDHPGHLRIDGGDIGASRFFGDASSLFLVERSDVPEDQSHLGRKVQYIFRPGWVESFIYERDSALRYEYTLSELTAQLPSRQEASRLAGIYFENVAWSTNIVEKDEFQEDFLDQIYPVTRPDAQLLAVVYLTLALGALFDPSLPPGANNNPYTRDLFALGRAGLTLDSSGTIIYVQAIHLMVTWFTNGGQVVSSNQSTWPLIGLAMRIVQALGLHRDGRHFGLPYAEIMNRRRIFWEIHAYDLMLAMSTGRPTSMASTAFDAQVPSTPEGGDCYHEWRYLLSWRVFSKVNDLQTAISPSPYETVLRYDRDFRKFQHDSPSQLSLDETPPPPGHPSQTLAVQRFTMRLQNNVGLLLLHRGWFARALLDEPEEPLRSKYSPSFIACLESCKLIIEAVRRAASEVPHLYHRRWFFLFHTFTACACLAAAVIRAPLSMLAQTSLLALEGGIKLFRTLIEKKNCFAQCGHSTLTNEDDLEMLGKGRKTTDHCKDTPQANLFPPSVDRQGRADVILQSHTSSTDSSNHDVDAVPPYNTSYINGGVAQPVEFNLAYEPFDGLNWGDGGLPAADFDVDAFLANFGISNDANEVLESFDGAGGE